jgi:hypothetical protein
VRSYFLYFLADIVEISNDTLPFVDAHHVAAFQLRFFELLDLFDHRGSFLDDFYVATVHFCHFA